LAEPEVDRTTKESQSVYRKFRKLWLPDSDSPLVC